ncbi:hypothetical protein OWR29_14725 [Actinoplanes sp. Pm04-4]|uniref:Uncharacterized protein n=1 Tax=Paractinoplanes pyxinae TaxID=2997416 RepID=A0ABT4AYC2_9ACTN|nr:hypothetical protein [Actinoplanes pyxinae]MCY1139251.1 hypothetical protein [Actinoplanes pyxinae]
MPVDELLTSLDPLPYRERMRFLAAWARTAPDRAEVCARLVTGSAYERQLALVASMVARDAAGIVAAASSPQPLLRNRLFDLRITELSAADRRKAYRTLRHLRDPHTADRLIREVREHFGDEEAAALLPACGASVVREMLPDLEFAANLEVVARRHPAILLEVAEERLAAAPIEQRRAVWGHFGAAVLSCEPARVLDLVERYPVEDYLPGALTAYGRLAAADPGRVARLLVDRNAARPLPPAVLRRLVVLPNEELVPLARTHFVALLEVLAPSRRFDLYSLASDERWPSVRVMELLPVRDRVRSAAQALDLVAPPLRAKYRSYLAWDEVSDALVAGTRTGAVAERERAWALLIGAARRSRDPRAVGLLRLDRLGNELDSVRSTALHALIGAHLTPAQASALTTAVLEARDTSGSTRAALVRLAVDTLRRHFDEPELREWALATIARVGEPLPSFEGVPAAAVFERLRGHVPVLALARALGPRAYDLPELQEAVRAAITTKDRDEAIRLWLADRRRRSERVEEVLTIDPYAVSLPEVWSVISSSRTDLLGRAMAPQPPVHVERWLPRQHEAYVDLLGSIVDDATQPLARRASMLRMAAVVPVLGRELVLSYRDGAGVVTGSGGGVTPSGRDVAGFGGAVTPSGRGVTGFGGGGAPLSRDDAEAVPSFGGEGVPLGRDAAGVVLAEAALGALPYTDRADEALSTLLEYAGSDRARVALYAAGRAAAHTVPSRLPALLGGVLVGPAKVTSRKAAARLLARYAPAEVMTTLLEVFPDAPPDVQTAIVSGARQRLDAEASWAILAMGKDIFDTVPSQISARHRPRYAELVAGACRRGERAAFTALPRWLPYVAAEDLVTNYFTDLGPEFSHIAALMPALISSGLIPVFTTLIERGARPKTSGSTERGGLDEGGDLIAGGDQVAGGGLNERGELIEGGAEVARRRIEAVARGTVGWARTAPAAVDRSAFVASARFLAGQPSYRPVGVLMLVGLGRLDNLDELADLCAGHPVLAVRTADQIRDRLTELRPYTDTATIRRLTARGDLAGGLFAVALFTDSRFRWPTLWHDMLRTLREHPEPEVRDEANAIDATHR